MWAYVYLSSKNVYRLLSVSRSGAQGFVYIFEVRLCFFITTMYVPVFKSIGLCFNVL